MRLHVVPIVSFICVGFDERLLADLRIVLRVPMLQILFAHRAGVAGDVIAGRFVLAGLRRVGHAEFRDFESALGTLKAISLGRFASAVQAQVHRILSVLEKGCMYVRHVAAVGPAQNSAHGHHARGRFVPTEHKVHAAYQMDEQVSSEAGTVFLPAAPAGENVCVEGALGNGALPGVPIESLRGAIGRGSIFPGAAGVVAAERAFDEIEIADDAGGEELLGFGAEDGADALRTDLHDAAGFFRGGDHGDAVGGRMGHRLFAIDVFAGVDGIHDDLFVPMIGNGGDDAVDLLVVEEFLIFARGVDLGAGNFFDDFFGERVAAIVEVGGSDAFDAGELNGAGEQAGTLHADANDAEADPVAGSDGGGGQRNFFGIEDDGARGDESAGGTGAALQEFAAGEIFFHDALLKKVDSRKFKVQTKNRGKKCRRFFCCFLAAIYLAPNACSARNGRKSGSRAAALQNYFSG